MTSIPGSVYDSNIRQAISRLSRLMKTDSLNVNMLMTTLNRLYFYMINAGGLTDIYLAVFIKQGGMAVLRAFQEFCIASKTQFKRADYDEIRYIVSLLILSLYKHYRLNDDYEITQNPFAVFSTDKVVD